VDGPCNSLHVPRIVACSFDSLVGRSRILIILSSSSDTFIKNQEQGKVKIKVCNRDSYFAMESGYAEKDEQPKRTLYRSEIDERIRKTLCS
jgi:hypothetical protein